jgi:hypothetical protein
MPTDTFQSACDRLSNAVDGVQFERLRWSRHEGPVLTSLVDFTQIAFNDRPDFEMNEEGSTRDEKRYTVKIYGNRVAALVFSIVNSQAAIGIAAVERGKCRVATVPPVSIAFTDVDQAWVDGALAQLFGHIEPLPA